MTDLNEIFSYEPDTGRLVWKTDRPGRGCVAGREAGTTTPIGYRAVTVDGRKYYAHRIVWELANGPIEDGMCIDHIDGDRANNRLSNLRLTTLSMNQRNAKFPRNNTSGIIGVYPKKKGFVVRCACRHIGYFTDFFEACCARKSAELRNGYHANHGRK